MSRPATHHPFQVKGSFGRFSTVICCVVHAMGTVLSATKLCTAPVLFATNVCIVCIVNSLQAKLKFTRVHHVPN